MQVIVFYDEKWNRIVLKRESDEYVNTKKLKENGIHYAKIDGKYEFVIYIDAITQNRLDKTKEYINKHNWEVVFSENFFTNIGSCRELDNAGYDEKLRNLFLQSTYDSKNKYFVEYQDSIFFSAMSDDDIGKEYGCKIRRDISNSLQRAIPQGINSIIDATLNFKVDDFVRSLIDDACETYRCYSCRYDVPIQTLYGWHENDILAPLDWIVRKSYIKVAIKCKYNINNCAPASMSIETVLGFINREINDGWDNNQAIVALSQLLNTVNYEPIDRIQIYKLIQNESFKPKTESENMWYEMFKSSERIEKHQALYLFDPIIKKHRES